jgi:uncharacterized protein
MTSQRSVDGFLRQHKVAVVGVSRSGRGFGHMAWKSLSQHGYEALPVNPNAEEIAGRRCYHSLAELPNDVGAALLVVPPAESEKVVREAASAGIRHIWMQQGAASPAALETCRELGVDAVSDECILMFIDQQHFPHNLHRWIWGALGKLPTS